MKQDIENCCLARVTEIMEREKDNLYRYACYRLGSPEEAEDLLQDLYLAMHSRRSVLRNVGRLDSYIYRSLSNACTSRLRSRSRRRFVDETALRGLAADNAAPDRFEREFLRIDRMLALLPAEQSETIRLRIHGGRSFAEIAEIVEAPVATVKSRYRYGIAKLREAGAADKLSD